MRSIRALALAGTVAVLMAACGGDEGGGDTTPTGLPSGLPTSLPSGLPTSLPSGIPTELPTGLPQGGLANGSAHLEFSGAATATFDLPIKNGAYVPNVAIGLAYQDDSNNTFTIAGTAFTGSVQTSSTVTLSYVITNPVIVGTSASGECTINLTDASATSVKGTAECQGIQGPTGAVNLTASFEATG
jgi:hypothetical protein